MEGLKLSSFWLARTCVRSCVRLFRSNSVYKLMHHDSKSFKNIISLTVFYMIYFCKDDSHLLFCVLVMSNVSTVF